MLRQGGRRLGFWLGFVKLLQGFLGHIPDLFLLFFFVVLGGVRRQRQRHRGSKGEVLASIFHFCTLSKDEFPHHNHAAVRLFFEHPRGPADSLQKMRIELLEPLRLTDLCSNHFAGDDDFHSAILLPSLIRAVVRHGLGLAQPNGCHRVCA